MSRDFGEIGKFVLQGLELRVGNHLFVVCSWYVLTLDKDES